MNYQLYTMLGDALIGVVWMRLRGAEVELRDARRALFTSRSNGRSTFRESRVAFDGDSLLVRELPERLGSGALIIERYRANV